MRTTIQAPARLFGKLLPLALAASLAGCLTINVNFPEHAVQKAADDFVGDLYSNDKTGSSPSDSDQAAAESSAVKSSVKKSARKKAKTPPTAVDAPSDATHPSPSATPGTLPADTTPSTWNLDLGIAEALAEEISQEITTSSPKADAIKERMRARVPEIKNWKEKGAICETADAMLVFKHPDKAGADAAAVKKLVTDENKDRDSFYQEVADINRITDRSQVKIRKFFAAAFRKHSPAGTCFEN